MKPVSCNDNIPCEDCYFEVDVSSNCRNAREEWCNEEYKEPLIDWSKVPVDTPILVRSTQNEEWLRRHFAKYKNGQVYAWRAGHTSWSKVDGNEDDYLSWKYAKLADDEVYGKNIKIQ